ncbi:MAG: NusG domain II-containing protein [Eubacterium sp.]|nr:NusG domain II-containing protein [Eubacterium sp.]
MKESFFRKNKKDIIIWAAVIVIGAALCLVLFLMKKTGKTVEVRVDGKVVATYNISDEVDTEIKGANGGYNRLVISGGQVRVSDADCPDKLCVHQGSIDSAPDSIVCLPHKLVVTVISDDEVPDAVSG